MMFCFLLAIAEYVDGNEAVVGFGRGLVFA